MSPPKERDLFGLNCKIFTAEVIEILQELQMAKFRPSSILSGSALLNADCTRRSVDTKTTCPSLLQTG